MHLMAEAGKRIGPEERRRRLVIGEVVTGRAYQSRKMILVENEADEPILGEQLRSLGMRAEDRSCSLRTLVDRPDT